MLPPAPLSLPQRPSAPAPAATSPQRARVGFHVIPLDELGKTNDGLLYSPTNNFMLPYL